MLRVIMCMVVVVAAVCLATPVAQAGVVEAVATTEAPVDRVARAYTKGPPRPKVRVFPPRGKINDNNNPYKMFWLPQDTTGCVDGPATPLQWASPSYDSSTEYMIVDGNTDIDVNNFKRSWADAQAFCQTFPGGNLVNIYSAEENTFVWCMNPPLENRWIGHRLTWQQSPDFAAELEAVRLSSGNPNKCFTYNNKLVCNANNAQIINKKGVSVDTSAVLRKGRRTIGSKLLSGNYSDDTPWIYNYSYKLHRFDGDGMNMVFGNPLTMEPYVTQGTYKTQVPWYENEPNNRRGAENCVEMGKAWSRHAPKGEWNDFNCNYEKAFVCKRPKQ